MTHGSQNQQDVSGLIKLLIHPKYSMKIGNWNVRTLYRSGNTAQVAREMKRRGIDVMGISETHWTGQRTMQLADGKTIIYSGRDDDNHREGVGMLMSNHAAASLMEWTLISERVIQARFYSKHIKLTIIHIYDTEDTDEQIKDEFYGRLQDALDSVSEHDMLIVTGEMNARNNNWAYESVMGKHGLGQRNDNGERLCDMCDMNEVVITATLFPHQTILKVTWVSPGGNAMNQIDHVLISRGFRNSVKDTRVYRSADIGSDHYLVCTVVKLRLSKQTTERKRCRVKYDTAKLRNEEVLRRFNIALQNSYQVLENEETAVEENEEVEQDFQVMKKAYTEVAESVLGRPRKKKPWISEESWSLTDQREELNKKILGTRSERVKKQLRSKYVEENREVKRSIKTDKKKWMENITCEAKEFARN